MTTLIGKRGQKGHKYFRWHDSGDLQGVEHLDKILAVCRNTPDVWHWLPTKEYRTAGCREAALPENLVIRLSGYYIDKMPKIPDKYKSFAISTVHTIDGVFPNAHVCPAPGQGGTCYNCRACWNPGIKQISYKEH